MELTKLKYKRKVSTNALLGILFFLMMGDYILTYVGIYVLGVIEEVNSLMVWLIKMPFLKGFIVRIFITLGSIVLLKYAEQFKNPVVYRKILLVPLGIQVIPYIAHMIWILSYLKFIS